MWESRELRDSLDYDWIPRFLKRNDIRIRGLDHIRDFRSATCAALANVVGEEPQA